MNFFDKLMRATMRNESLLCIGLDPTPESLPPRYRTDKGRIEDDLLRWHLAIIEETHELVCTYKPNIAFYEALGEMGMKLLRDTLAAIPDEIPVLLDVKRGDMGPTAVAYAKACFEVHGVDAVTLSPYLGRDSIDPFAAYVDKGLFVLCHTSNPSAENFQTLTIDGLPLYLHVAKTAKSWSPNVGFVVGATYPEALRAVREVAPDAWFLVPGIGAQGGDIESAISSGLRRDDLGLILSASRGVTLAANHRAKAQEFRDKINQARLGVRA